MRLGHVVGGGAWDARGCERAGRAARGGFRGTRDTETVWDAVRQRLLRKQGVMEPIQSGHQPNETVDIETREWLESLDFVIENGGPERVLHLLQHLQIRAEEAGSSFRSARIRRTSTRFMSSTSRCIRASGRSSGASRA